MEVKPKFTANLLTLICHHDGPVVLSELHWFLRSATKYVLHTVLLILNSGATPNSQRSTPKDGRQITLEKAQQNSTGLAGGGLVPVRFTNNPDKLANSFRFIHNFNTYSTEKHDFFNKIYYYLIMKEKLAKRSL